MWIVFTVIAAFTQAFRNAFQKRLSERISAIGTTAARFVGGIPLALIYLTILYATGEQHLFDLNFTGWFFIYCAVAAGMQIAATALMVNLFQQKNYAIGVGLAKSEAIVAALIGSVLLADQFSLYGWLGIVIGTVAVFLLSGGFKLKQISWQSLWIGLGSGFCFAVTSLLVREASLELTDLPTIYRAAWVLLAVLTVQSIGLSIWLAMKEPQTIVAMKREWKLVASVSLASFTASWGWFNAMALVSVALVKTLGQVEVLFTLLISWLLLREKLKATEIMGLLLIVIGAILVIWA